MSSELFGYTVAGRKVRIHRVPEEAEPDCPLFMELNGECSSLKPLSFLPTALKELTDPQEIAEFSYTLYPYQPREMRKRWAPLLWIAVDRCHIQAVRMMLLAGVLQVSDDTLELSPLHLALLRRNIELVSLLIAAGANVNAVDGLDRTPLHLASNKEEFLLSLLLAGADVTKRNRNHFRALDELSKDSRRRLEYPYPLDIQQTLGRCHIRLKLEFNRFASLEARCWAVVVANELDLSAVPDQILEHLQKTHHSIAVMAHCAATGRLPLI